jgi:hypothetical protein
MGKFIIIFLFALLVAIMLLAYERPAKGKKNITGRGGDFE